MKQEYFNQAIKNMKLADHILTMTYPLVQDPKLLKLVLQKVFLSMNNAMKSLCYSDNKTPPNNFEKLTNEIKHILIKNNISLGYINFLNKLNDTVKKRKKAGVEFIRKEKFVFANDDYKLNILTKEDLKDYIIKGKLFMKEVKGVIT